MRSLPAVPLLTPREAASALQAAEDAYLAANGWIPDETRTWWVEPPPQEPERWGDRSRRLHRNHAVNRQKWLDRTATLRSNLESLR